MLHNTTRKLIEHMGHSSDSWTGCFTKSMPGGGVGGEQRDYSRFKKTRDDNQMQNESLD